MLTRPLLRQATRRLEDPTPLGSVALPVLIALLALASGLAGCGAPAARGPAPLATNNPYFRVDYTADSTKDGKPRLTGYLYNDRDIFAANVTLGVKVLDAAGAVVGSTTDTVYGNVPPFNRSYFDVILPATGTSYQVDVLAVDWRGYGGGGG